MAKHKYIVEETSVFAVVAEGESEALAKTKPSNEGYLDPVKAVRIAHQITITENDEEGRS